MKKRIISLLLVLLMTISFMPSYSFISNAEGTGSEVCYIDANANGQWDDGETKYDSVGNALSETIKGESKSKPTTIILIHDTTENITLTKDRFITLDLNGYVLSGDSTTYVVKNSATLTIKDSNANKTHNFKVGEDGLWTLTSETENAKAIDSLTARPKSGDIITVAGGCITGGVAASGGGIYSSKTFTLNGGNIVGNKATSTSTGGGGVYSTAHFYMTGGAILGNLSTTKYGGGIYSSHICSISAGIIAFNCAPTGGGIYIKAKDKEFSLSGFAVIKYNYAESSSGGIYIQTADTTSTGENAKVSLKGGTIIGNSSKSGIGGVYIAKHSDGPNKVTLSGNLKICDNIRGSKLSNLHLSADKTVNVENPNGMLVGTTSTDTDFATGTSAGYDAYFTADDFSYKVVRTDEGVLKTEKKDILEITSENDITRALVSLNKTQSWKLKNDITLKKAISIASDYTITLDLDGYVLTGNGKDTVIENKGTLTLKDSNSESKKHNFKVDENGLWTLTSDTEGAVKLSSLSAKPDAGTIVTVEGGCITGGTGKLSSNKYYGGGIFNIKSFTLAGGNIIGNKSANGGGGIYSSNSYTSTGGIVLGNTSSSGGALYSSGKTCEIKGGEYIFNTVTANGGGIYASGKTANYDMSAGTVKYNYAKSNGGGVYISLGNYSTNQTTGIAKLTGGTVSGNSITSTSTYGGGVYVAAQTDCTMDLTLGGKFNVSGNYKAKALNNMYFAESAVAKLSDPDTTMSIGIAIFTGDRTFATDISKVDAAYFKHDNFAYDIVRDDEGKLTTLVKTKFDITSEEEMAAALSGPALEQEWTIKNDITLSKQLKIAKTSLKINGGGFKIIGNDAEAGSGSMVNIYQVSGGSTSVIMDNLSLVCGTKFQNVLLLNGAENKTNVDVTLKNVTVDHTKNNDATNMWGNGAPIINNSSTLRVKGKLTIITCPSSYCGINLDTKYANSTLSFEDEDVLKASLEVTDKRGVYCKMAPIVKVDDNSNNSSYPKDNKAIAKGNFVDNWFVVFKSFYGGGYNLGTPQVVTTDATSKPTFTFGTASTNALLGTAKAAYFPEGTTPVLTVKVMDKNSSSAKEVTDKGISASIDASGKVKVTTTKDTPPATYYVKVTATAGDTTASASFTVTVNKISIKDETVTLKKKGTGDTYADLSGAPCYGDTLKAVLSNSTADVTYQWYRNGVTKISGATGETYTLTADDIGTKISVIITGKDNYSGQATGITSANTTKANGPAAPTVTIDYTAEKTTQDIATTVEYKKSTDTEWTLGSDAKVDLLPGTTYQFRVKETTTTSAGTETSFTVPARPTVTGVTAEQESVQNKKDAKLTGVTSAMEYKIGSGNWTDGEGKDIANPDNTTIYVRLKASNTAYQGTETTFTFTASSQKLKVIMGNDEPEVEYNSLVTKPDNPNKDGYTFGGWYKDTKCKEAWNFEVDKVTESITLYANWIENSKDKASVTGKVMKGIDPVSDAIVELMLGTDKVAATTTNANGEYSFGNVENGNFNIVVTKDDKVKTSLVNISEPGTYTIPNVELPSNEINSKVIIEGNKILGSKSDATLSTIGDIDTFAEALNLQAGDTLTVNMTIEPKANSISDTQQVAIRENAIGYNLDFIDITLTKQINEEEPTEILDTDDKLITINIPFDTTSIESSSIKVYRYHEAAAETLAKITNADEKADGKYMISNSGITIYSTKFCTYGIGYKTSDEMCIYGGSLVEGLQQTLIFGGKTIHGSFDIIKTDDGFQIKSGNEYLAFNATKKKVILSENEYTWKYNGGLYSEIKTTTTKRVLFWKKTTTNTTKYYLDCDGEQFLLSNDKVAAKVQIAADEHEYTYIHDNDGSHEAVCINCGKHEEAVAHDYSYDTENHKCICGKIDPAECYVKDVKVTEKKITKKTGILFWKKTVTKYKYTLEVETQNVSTKKVECSATGEDWESGTTFTSDVHLDTFFIKVTDTNGKVTNWKYENSEVVPAN